MSHHLIEQKHKLSLVLISPLTFCVPHFIGLVQEAALPETGIYDINDHERRPQNCIARVELLRNCRNLPKSGWSKWVCTQITLKLIISLTHRSDSMIWFKTSTLISKSLQTNGPFKQHTRDCIQFQAGAHQGNKWGNCERWKRMAQRQQ